MTIDPITRGGARRLAAAGIAAAAMCLVPVGAAFAAPPADGAAVAGAPAHTPADVLAATAWETTGAVDQDGAPVDLADARAASFVGLAYYDPAGTFRMYELDGAPKMQGDWSVAADGSSRTIVARDADGAERFTRTVEITVLDDGEFTYRVPDAADPSRWVDIVHTPTSAPEPSTTTPAPTDGTTAPDDARTPSELLASTAWETTGALDVAGAPVDLADPAVVDFVGWAYYDLDGTFRIYELDDTPKMQGDWSVDEAGTTRTIVARDDAGAELFTRTVEIVELTAERFTYRIADPADPAATYDIVHTPTDHAEPGGTAPTAAPTDEPGATTTAGAPGTPTATTDGREGALAETGADAPLGALAIAVGALALLGATGIALGRRVRGAAGTDAD